MRNYNSLLMWVCLKPSRRSIKMKVFHGFTLIFSTTKVQLIFLNSEQVVSSTTSMTSANETTAMTLGSTAKWRTTSKKVNPSHSLCLLNQHVWHNISQSNISLDTLNTMWLISLTKTETHLIKLSSTSFRLL